MFIIFTLKYAYFAGTETEKKELNSLSFTYILQKSN